MRVIHIAYIYIYLLVYELYTPKQIAPKVFRNRIYTPTRRLGGIPAMFCKLNNQKTIYNRNNLVI